MTDKRMELAQPAMRDQLVAELQELAAEDLRRLWRDQRQQNLVVGIDEVFHFFFDDHDFDAAEVGVTLFDLQEVAVIEDLKLALDALLGTLGDVGDDLFIEHADWWQVRLAAQRALARLAA